MKRLLSRRAQNLTEVALILATIGLVFIGMEVYIKRGLQGKIKDITDAVVGKEQSEYASDTSGLSVLDSSSGTSANSSTQVSTSTGGSRQTTKSDSISATSTSHSEYQP